jgi:hypothetical protein
LIAKALILKKVKRFKSRSKAETLLREIIEKDINLVPQLRLFVIVNLCDLLLEELKILNNEDIIKDLGPLIGTMLEIAELKKSFLWLAQIKHLQANLALIQNNFREAKKLMIQAQKIAEMHGINILAIKISDEHDSLLDQSNLWNELMETNAPISERIKFASIEPLLNNISGKREIKKTKIEEEEPIFLLIMSKDGNPHFTHSFQDRIDIEPLFSSFLSAFNSFGSELFSNSIDRINIGEYRILINPLENFLFCYVIIGQSYLAKKKLSKFTSEIRSDPRIRDALNLSVKTGKMLELDNPPELGRFINQIFYRK